jgi:hypothetical protein
VSVLEKVRQWIDGESAERVLEEAARDGTGETRSKAEEFIVRSPARSKASCRMKWSPCRQGTTIIPSEYTIFLSSDDDKEWQGVQSEKAWNRVVPHTRGTCQRDRRQEKAGNQSFVIELRIDEH